MTTKRATCPPLNPFLVLRACFWPIRHSQVSDDTHSALFRQISSQPSGVLVCLDSRGELATWGLCRNFVTAFMSFRSTNPLARCRKFDGGIPDATQQNRAFMLD